MKNQILNFAFTLVWLVLSMHFLMAQEVSEYQMPPASIMRLAEAEPTPSARISPDGNYMLLLDRPAMPSIDIVSQPELRIGGLRINPAINGRARAYLYTGITLMNIRDKSKVALQGIPSDAGIGAVSWSPDGGRIAFTLQEDDGISLWMAEIASFTARRLTEPVLNNTLSRWPYRWYPSGEKLLYFSVDTERGAAPEENRVPAGPVIRENTGEVAPARTYQDLLENEYDEQLFEYYTTSILKTVDLNNTIQVIGKKGIIYDAELSPDASYLLVRTIRKPFSYLVPYYRFAQKYEIWTSSGVPVIDLADIPVADNIPIGFGSVRMGPRNYTWRNDAPSQLYWVEAQDSGNANIEADIRDMIYSLNAPFSGSPEEVLPLKLRYGGITWGTGDLAIVSEYWWKSRQIIQSRFAPDAKNPKKITWFDRSFEDAYNDPGNFVTIENSQGKSVLLTDNRGKTLYLFGDGASPEGNKPFIDVYDIKSGNTERLWQSSGEFYERPLKWLNLGSKELLTRRESVEQVPNYYIRDIAENDLDQVTDFKHPYPELRDVKKQFLKYTREDGVQLTGTLYLPYQEDERNKNLPTLLWAYPREFKSADAAGQVKDSPYRFTYMYWGSPLYWLTRGYAVLDDPTLPIIGEGDEEPNDTYVDQLVSGARAAVDTVVAMGVTDPDRVAIGGHSYGAFMTANLLAHSDIFAAGIARSGAYNRTLTPFGFQAEERTFWEAPDIYFAMSPFMHADKVDEPILLIHGEADNNSGTYPMQSERFYTALKGHGAIARLVMLPAESHGYRARESILHMLWEMDRWLENYVKNE